MEPRIQYALAPDGVSIACWAEGEGVPIIHMPPIPWSHLQVELEGRSFRRYYERLASVARLVRYDARGSGLSEERGEWEGDDYLLDIDAVADRFGLERFVLFGNSVSGPSALAYAAARPERVSHLILWCCAATTEEARAPQITALSALAERDWEMFTNTIAHGMVAGWGAPEEGAHFAAVMRAASSAECINPAEKRVIQDAQAVLGQIQAPTLVMHRREVLFPPLHAARQLAARIPNAQLALLEGGAVLPYVGDVDSVHRAIERFLGLKATSSVPDHDATHHGPHTHGGALRTILFTDLESHTAMMQRLGDQAGRDLLRAHEQITRRALREHGGDEVKSMGDGFMASFGSAQKALECAVALQAAFAAHNEAHEAGEELRVRVGINAGEPIEEEDDLFGTAVILAARIAAQAEGGEILVANVVRELTAGKGFLFADRGDRVLRGFEDPVRVYELRWR